MSMSGRPSGIRLLGNAGAEDETSAESVIDPLPLEWFAGLGETGSSICIVLSDSKSHSDATCSTRLGIEIGKQHSSSESTIDCTASTSERDGDADAQTCDTDKRLSTHSRPRDDPNSDLPSLGCDNRDGDIESPL